jgi:sec-independent protein translocase protein TatB
MFFGLTIEKLLLIGVIAAVLIGPERLPRYAEGLAHWASRTRDFLRGARSRVKEEMGPDFDDVDWRKLDPRQYDPRRIIREALLDDAPVPTVRAAQAAAVVSAMTAEGQALTERTAGAGTPFDSEAT